MAFFSWFYSIALSFYDFLLALSALPMRTRGIQAGYESQELCEVVDELVNGCSLMSVRSANLQATSSFLQAASITKALWSGILTAVKPVVFVFLCPLVLLLPATYLMFGFHFLVALV